MSLKKPPREPRPDLSIIIVSWNTREMLRDCLQSVDNNKSGITAEIFVIDNASADGSARMVACEFPHVRLIRNHENRGFAAANNQALKLASGRHVLLLNSDTLVHADVLANSVAYLDAEPQVGAMGCRVLNRDGSLQLTCSAWPGLRELLLLTSGLAKLPFRHFHFYRYDSWKRADAREVGVISGCYLMLRQDVLERVGLLDEDFFFFGEEADWCRRIRQQGWKLMLAPVGEITHFGGGSSAPLSHRRDVMLSQATVRLHLKHEGWLSALAVYCLLFAFNLSRLAFWRTASLMPFSGARARARFRHFRGVVMGYRDAWPEAAR